MTIFSGRSEEGGRFCCASKRTPQASLPSAEASGVGARGVAEEGGDWANLDDEDHERIVWEHFCVLTEFSRLQGAGVFSQTGSPARTIL